MTTYNEYGESDAHGFPALRRKPLSIIKITVPICKDGWDTGEREIIECTSQAEAQFYRYSRNEQSWRTHIAQAAA